MRPFANTFASVFYLQRHFDHEIVNNVEVASTISGSGGPSSIGEAVVMKLRTFLATFSAVSLSCVGGMSAASAAVTVMGQQMGTTLTNVPPDLDLSVTTGAIAYQASADNAMRMRLAAEFPTWTFNYVNTGLNGTLNIATYRPRILGDDNGGAEIDLTYTTGNGDPALGTCAGFSW